MTYSYTQISQYLTCPRRYRHRYLDGWKEKDTRAAMLFGRAFEQALGALFRQEDPGAVLFAEWSACQSQDLHYSNRRLLGSHAPARDHAVDPVLPGRSRPGRPASTKSADQVHTASCWKQRLRLLYRCHRETRRQALPAGVENLFGRYPEEPKGLLALDPQLVCYSWMTGIAEVAQVVFVRKRLVEVQYLRTTITEEQRQEFGRLVEGTIRRIESADFLPHSGIRFPQNPCSSCPYVGLCLGKQEMVDAALVRRPGADNLGWLDELNY